MSPPLVFFVTLGAVALILLVRGVALGYPPATPDAPQLSGKEQAIVAAAADAMFPAGGVLPISGAQAGVVRYFGETLAGSPTRHRVLLRLLLRLVEHGPWVLNLRGRFTSQRHAERVATLRSWAESPIYLLRVAFTSLRTLLSIAYLADEGVTRAMGAEPDTDPFRLEQGRAA